MKEKKQKKRWGLMVFIVMIMVGTSFSLFTGFQSQSQTADYNGIKFSNKGNAWIAEINGRQAAFSFLPQDVADINISGDLAGALQGKYQIDSTSDANSTLKEPIALAQYQMGMTLSTYNIYIRKGFTSNSTFNVPIIVCTNATQNIPIIRFSKSNSTGINVKANCVSANALTAADIIRVKDRILYSTLGVIK